MVCVVFIIKFFKIGYVEDVKAICVEPACVCVTKVITTKSELEKEHVSKEAWVCLFTV